MNILYFLHANNMWEYVTRRKKLQSFQFTNNISGSVENPFTMKSLPNKKKIGSKKTTFAKKFDKNVNWAKYLKKKNIELLKCFIKKNAQTLKVSMKYLTQDHIYICTIMA